MGCIGSKKVDEAAVDVLLTQVANKVLIKDFFDRVIIPKCLDCLDEFVDPSNYIEHDPYMSDGLKDLRKWLANWFTHADEFYYGIEHLVADDDLVWVHSKCMLTEGRNAACVDIFRIRESKIIEHWDVTQFTPPAATSKHPMF